VKERERRREFWLFADDASVGERNETRGFKGEEVGRNLAAGADAIGMTRENCSIPI
jgi:hypothetical protein